MTAEHRPSYSELPPFPWRRIVNPADIADIGTTMLEGASPIQSIIAHMMGDLIMKIMVDWQVECKSKGLNPELTLAMVQGALSKGYSQPIVTLSKADAYDEDQYNKDVDLVAERGMFMGESLSEKEKEDSKWVAAKVGLIEGVELATLKGQLDTKPVPEVMSTIIKMQRQKVATSFSSPNEARIAEEALEYCEDRFRDLYQATIEAFPEQR